MAAPNTWTADMEDTLRALWREGLSTAVIGDKMGVSKNAVISKAGRMDLPQRGNPCLPEGKRITGPRRRAKKPPAERMRRGAAGMEEAQRRSDAIRAAQRAEPPPPVAPREPYLRFAGRHIAYPADLTCQWIMGEVQGAETRFCGAGRVPHRPYCAAHCARAYDRASRLDDVA